MPNRRCNEPFKSSQGEADPKRRLLQFDVQEFCDNFVEEVVKTLKDVNQTNKKSTSTRAPVDEQSLFISKKSKGKSETHVEELKDFSDSLPIYDEYDEEPIESLMICEKNCNFPSSESEFMNDNEQTIVELTILQPEHPSSLVLSQQVFEEEPLDYPHQRPRLDSKNPLDENLGPIFDEEDEPGPVFDEETTSITSIVMESHLCFDPDTSPVPLTPDLQENLFVLSFQERQVQPLRNKSNDRVQQSEIWRSFVVQTGYLGDASDRGFTEAWNHLKSFTEEGVMNFPNRRFDVVSLVVSNEHDNHDQFPRRASTGEHLRTCSTDQYMEPAQHGVQDVLNISTEVHVFHRTGQTDRAVYWTVPHPSGKELWLEPWPDDRSDRTSTRPSQQSRQAKANSRARLMRPKERTLDRMGLESCFRSHWAVFRLEAFTATSFDKERTFRGFNRKV
uniref:Uncharacterized protein n=1 Tax=Brassica campestris TaxID=3711 RepID=M4FER8_BRACM